jgi:hypothetical protein
MAVPTTLVIDATQQTLEITTSRDAVSIQGRSIETGTPTDGEVLTYSSSASEWIYLSVDENVDDRVAALIQDSAGGGLTWTYDDAAGTLTPAYVGDSTLVTTGALSSGSISSGFGTIDIGSSALTAGAASFTTLNASGSSVFIGDVTIGNEGADALTLYPNAWTLSNAVTITGTWTNLGTVTTVDINGGAIDGATVGAASASTGAFTTIAGSVSLALATGSTVTGIDNGSLGTSATLLATQGAIKTYIDAQVTAQDLDIISDSGTIDIDLDSESLTLAGGTGLDSSASSTTVTFAIDSTVATLAGSQTLTNKTLTTPVISSISNTGTVTLPTSTDTLVGKATTDTFTNKSISGSTNTLSAIANGSLTNSTVAYGGVSLSLGGADTTPAFDLSDADSYPGDSALVTVGTISSGTWSADTVAVNKGGTGLVSYAAGDVIYASGATTLAKLAKGSDTQVLTLASGVPSWATPEVGDITSVVAGTGLSGGGTSGDVTLNVEAAQTQITSVGALAAGSIASGFTSISTSYTDAKVTSVVAGTLVDVSGATGDVTVSADLSELSTSTSDGDGDFFAVVDAANAQKKLTKANISIAGFNTAVATSVTGVGILTAGTWTADVISGAYIDPTSSPLANTKLWIGSASNVAAEFALSGNATMTAGGVVTVTAPAGTLTGTTLKSTVVTSSLTAVGTIATGVWNGTKVASAYLDDDTAHLSGTQTFSGAKTFSAALAASSTLAVTGNTTIGAGATAFLTVTNTTGTGGTTIDALGGPVEGNFKSADAANTAATRWTFGRDNQTTGDFVFLKNGAAQGRFLTGSVGMTLPGTLGVTGTTDFADTLNFSGAAGSKQEILMGSVSTISRGSTGAVTLATNAGNLILSPAGDVQIGTATNIAGNLTVTATGPHSFGAAANGDYQINFGGAYTATGGGALGLANFFSQTFTGAVGNTAWLATVAIAGVLTTQDTDTNIGLCSSLAVNAPNINNNLASGGKPDVASAVHIVGAPTEGDVNAALYVEAGNIIHAAMATSDPSVAGAFWNDSGTVKISSG